MHAHPICPGDTYYLPASPTYPCAHLHMPNTGNIRYLSVRGDSELFRLGIKFGFTAFAITLGSSYFQAGHGS